MNIELFSESLRRAEKEAGVRNWPPDTDDVARARDRVNEIAREVAEQQQDALHAQMLAKAADRRLLMAKCHLKTTQMILRAKERVL